jgi:hypothetical protein
MELIQTFQMAAPRERVWAALNDPVILKSCIAGCESFEPDGPDAFRCVVAASIGPVKARFNAKVTLSGIEVPTRYTLAFDGQGGAAGFGRGSAEVELTDVAGGTALCYRAKAQVGGKLAQVGSRLIDAAASKVASDFFEKFAQQVGEPTPAAAPEVAMPQGDTRFPIWFVLVAIMGFAAVVVTLLRH